MPRWCVILLCCLAVASSATESSSAQRHSVEVAPARTSIYLGTVTLTMPAFTRVADSYLAIYKATVFPYFFLDETGTLRVEVPDEQLEHLARGEPIGFTGQAVRSDGVERRVIGEARPVDARSGKLKVRVFVSRKIDLIFNTTYRFADP